MFAFKIAGESNSYTSLGLCSDAGGGDYRAANNWWAPHPLCPWRTSPPSRPPHPQSRAPVPLLCTAMVITVRGHPVVCDANHTHPTTAPSVASPRSVRANDGSVRSNTASLPSNDAFKVPPGSVAEFTLDYRAGTAEMSVDGVDKGVVLRDLPRDKTLYVREEVKGGGGGKTPACHDDDDDDDEGSVENVGCGQGDARASCHQAAATWRRAHVGSGACVAFAVCVLIDRYPAVFLDYSGLKVYFVKCYQVPEAVASKSHVSTYPRLAPTFGSASRTSMLLSAGVHVVRGGAVPVWLVVPSPMPAPIHHG